MPPSAPVPARTMTALNCLLAAGLTVLHYQTSDSLERNGCPEIRAVADQASDRSPVTFWRRFCCVTWHPSRSWWEAPYLTLTLAECCHWSSSSFLPGVQVWESYMMIFGVKISYLEKTDWVLLLAVAISLIILSYMYLARNTELQNWDLSF